MHLRLAEVSDIEDVLKLHYRYHLDSISPEDKNHGFVTTPFTVAQLENLIREEQGLSIVRVEGELVAYAMAASWGFWSQWPMFVFMMNGLSQLQFANKTLSVANSYQYGPVCIDRRFRGVGVLENLFEFSRQQMANRYPVLVTFINKRNPRSFAAHTRKIGLQVIQEFHYNGGDFYELGYDTTKPLS